MRDWNKNYVIVANTNSEYWDLSGNLRFYTCVEAHKKARAINRIAGYRAAIAIKLETAYSQIHPNCRKEIA